MGDFAQPGLICTLQQLNRAHAETLERDLAKLARRSPIALILPCHARDLEQPALAGICRELAGAEWLHEIVVSLNGLTAEGFRRAQEFFSRLPRKVGLLWNDGPHLTGIYQRLLGANPAAFGLGKGFNVWAAMGVLTANSHVRTIAAQDCDVVSFQRGTLARLCFACADPEMNFVYSKMYYSRVTDRIYGRVSRLFFAPLLQALVHVAGHHPLLDFLLSFRYPLAGEFAMARSLAENLPGAGGWRLEIATLCELFRRSDPREICQVDGGSGYDHKHQPAADALVEMCREVAQEVLTQLAREGIPSDPAFHHALARAFTRESADALRRYAALARINGLPFDPAEESAISHAFAGILHDLTFTSQAALPSWASLRAEQPAAVEDFMEAALYTG